MLKAAVLALAMAASAASAGAAPLIEDFRAICQKSDADPKSALASADAAGWMHIPDALLAQLMAAAKGLSNPDGRLRSDSSGLRFLIVARTGPNLPPDALIRGIDHANVCVVGSAPPEPNFPSEFAAWAGVPEEPTLSKGPAHGYAFTADGPVHKQVDPKGPDMAKLIKAGTVRLAFIESDATVAMAGIAVPSKEPN